jgi:hypothetical protein
MTRKAHAIKIDGNYYPRPNRRWGGCAEELFHHTSRYYHYTEAFLRNLSGNRDFLLEGYHAEQLSEPQRRLMAAILSMSPGQDTGEAAIRVVVLVRGGREDVDEDLMERYRHRLHVIPLDGQSTDTHVFHEPVPPPEGLPSIDPFMAVAERLQIPVAVNGRYVEVSMRQLARHLDSPQPRIRENLQHAVLWLHDAGYHLRNHPDLTHGEAHIIGGDSAV